MLVVAQVGINTAIGNTTQSNTHLAEYQDMNSQRVLGDGSIGGTYVV